MRVKNRDERVIDAKRRPTSLSWIAYTLVIQLDERFNDFVKQLLILVISIVVNHQKYWMKIEILFAVYANFTKMTLTLAKQS